MRKIRLLITSLLLITATAKGQAATLTDYDFRSRTSIGMDWKISNGLHLDAGYELRTADKFSRIERNQFSIGVRYSPIRYLGIGAGYYFIGHYNNEMVLKPKHRLYFDLTGSYKFEGWKLSLRERIQMTHKSYDFNEYQQTPDLVELKSKLKLAYKGFIHLEPYIYVELRNCFNGPSFNADYDETSGKYTNYEFIGYSDAYVNRLRGAIGVEWKINANHSIDFKIMSDWCKDKVIDTNAEGTKLKSYSWMRALNTSLAIGHVFSFWRRPQSISCL